MIKYNVGDLVECESGVWLVIKADNENSLPWKHKYEVLSLSGQVKQVELFHLTHRCI